MSIPVATHRGLGEGENEPLKNSEVISTVTATSFLAQKRRFALILVLVSLVLIVFLAQNGKNSDDEEIDDHSGEVSENITTEAGTNVNLLDDLPPTDRSKLPEDTVQTVDIRNDDGVYEVDEGDEAGVTEPSETGRTRYPAYLRNVSCIPAQCSVRKHFIYHPEHLADKHGFTLLASFPGAGNTWTRSISKFSPDRAFPSHQWIVFLTLHMVKQLKKVHAFSPGPFITT